MLQDRPLTCDKCGQSSNYPKNEAYKDGVTCKNCNKEIDTTKLKVLDVVKAFREED